ncbi:hypothetical protein ACEUAB_03355 [Aeromonas veronii]
MNTFNNHHGHGDIVNGSKNTIISDLEINKVMAVINNVLKDICHFDYTKAKETIKSLRDTNSLSENVRHLIDAIEYKVDIHVSKNISSPIPEGIKTLIRDMNVDDNTKDIVSSVWMQSSIVASFNKKNDAEELCFKEAIDIYNVSPKLQYTQELYNKFIANESALISFFNEKNLLLTEIEFIGVILGLCRVGNFELANEHSTTLLERYPSTLTKIYKAYSCALKIYNNKDFVHIWSTSRCIYNEIVENTKLIIDIFDNAKHLNYDPLFVALFITSQLCDGRDDELSQLIKIHENRIAATISNSPTPTSSDIINPDLEKKSNLRIDEFLTSSHIDDEQFDIIYPEIASKKLKKRAKLDALHSSIEVKSEDAFIGKFKTIMLRSELMHQTNDYSKIPELKELISSLFENHADRLSLLYPPIVAMLSEKLIALKLSEEACRLLERFISNEPTPSPLYLVYLNSLINSERWETLYTTLRLVPQNEWGYSQWMANAAYHNELKEHTLAIYSINEAILLDNSIPSAWIQLIKSNINNNTSKDELNTLIHSIPDKVFELADSYTFHLLKQIMLYIDYDFAENISHDIFMQNPEKYAPYITELYFHTLKSDAKNINANYKSKYCVRAVSYTVDDKINTKIIVRGLERLTDYMIDEDSSFGDLLLSMNVGETAKFQMNNITLNEIKPINIACFHYALSLTESTPNECMPIKSIQVPDNPDELIGKLEAELSSMQPKSLSEFTEEYASFPLCFRPLFVPQGEDIVNSIFFLFENKLSNSKIHLHNMGSKDISEFLVDLFGLIYLVLCGYTDCICEKKLKLYVTSETNDALKKWLSIVEDPSFLRIGIKDGRLVRTNAKDIQAVTNIFRLSIKKLLNIVTIIEPTLNDTPRELFELKDLIDKATYSTIRYAITSEIPYFTLDSSITKIFPEHPIKLLDSEHLTDFLNESTSIDNKIEAIKYHLKFDFPYQILNKDVILLSKDDNESNLIICSQIIIKYMGNFTTIEDGVNTLSSILLSPLIIASSCNKLARGGKTHDTQCNTEIERLFYACSLSISKVSSQLSAEEKVCNLWINLIRIIDCEFKSNILLNLKSKTIKYIEYLGSNFCRGYFLDINRVNELIFNALHKQK